MNNRYEIREEIGKGGLGAVYKAFDTQLQRDVAMKRVLTTEHASQEEVNSAAAKLIAEAQTLSSLNHPNIVTVFDVGQDGEGGFVVMELLKGETLDETVERGVLTQDDFIEVVTQTMEALIAAQANSVIHRDLKPTNVMVIWQPSGKFQTKILDFGLAKFSKTPSVQTMDQEDAVMGSIYFMAPEQFERGELDERSDLYQIGCVYYFALTGQYPFRGETAPQVMNAHMQHRVTPLEKMRPDMSPSICQWVMWLINRQMENRPANAREALERFPKNPERPGSEPILQAIPVEETGTSATTGVHVVVVPDHDAEPPSRLITVAEADTEKRLASKVYTGPHRHHTGSIDPARKKKYKIIAISAAAVVILAVVGVVIANKIKTNLANERLREMASVETPKGNAGDVQLALDFLTDGKAPSEQKQTATQVLTALEGAGVDEAILEALRSGDSPYIRWKLSQVASDRGLEAAVPAMMGAFHKATSESQKLDILNSVRKVATQGDMPALVEALSGNYSPQIRGLFEDILIAIFRRSPITDGLTKPLVSRLSNTSGDERKSLFRVLGALGTKDVKTRLESIFSGSGGDKAYEYDAMAALLKWPDRSLLDMVKSIYDGTSDIVLRIGAFSAFVRMASLPAPVSISDRVETWKIALEWLKSAQRVKPQDQVLIFASMIEYSSPETLALAKSYEGDPKLGATAKQAGGEIEKVLKGAPTGGAETQLLAGNALIRGLDKSGAYFNPESESITLWKTTDTWFVWHINSKETGAFNVQVVQSYTRVGECHFAVLSGTNQAEGKAEKTESLAKFTSVPLEGAIQMEAGNVYTIVLYGKGITQPRMMDFKMVKLTRQ